MPDALSATPDGGDARQIGRGTPGGSGGGSITVKGAGGGCKWETWSWLGGGCGGGGTAYERGWGKKGRTRRGTRTGARHCEDRVRKQMGAEEKGKEGETKYEGNKYGGGEGGL